MRLAFGLNFFIVSGSLTYTIGSFWLLYEIYSIKEKTKTCFLFRFKKEKVSG
jgi:hypothetical protein